MMTFRKTLAVFFLLLMASHGTAELGAVWQGGPGSRGTESVHAAAAHDCSHCAAANCCEGQHACGMDAAVDPESATGVSLCAGRCPLPGERDPEHVFPQSVQFRFLVAARQDLSFKDDEFSFIAGEVRRPSDLVLRPELPPPRRVS